MTPRGRPFEGARSAALLIALAVSAPCAAIAGEPAHLEALTTAERAYQNVDFSTAYAQANRAIHEGNASLDETTRANVLVGLAAAALGKEEEAKRAFITALGVNPALKLDRSLSPKIRGPYLEAQGFWGAYSDRLIVDAKRSEDRGRLSVRLVDPAGLVKKVEAHVRATGAPEFRVVTLGPDHAAAVAVTNAERRAGFEYFLRAMDEFGNALAEAGAATDPRVEPADPDGTASKPTAPGAPPEPSPTEPTRSYLLPTILGVAGLASAGVGVAFHLQREGDARSWNGPGCEHPGKTRLAQCGDVDSRIRTDERVAVGAYALGGVLLTGSVISLLVGGPSPKERPPEARSAGLSGCGIAGRFVACQGSF